ncbi:MAG: hypothetical protein WAK16_13215, partial [Candidatus Cybelea sp.]
MSVMCQACVSPVLVASVWNKLLPSRGKFLAGAAAFGAALSAARPFRASADDEVTVIFKNGMI